PAVPEMDTGRARRHLRAVRHAQGRARGRQPGGGAGCASGRCRAARDRGLVPHMIAGVLSGRVALVTGASSGIGEATALVLARHGAKVAVAARRRDRLEQLVLRIAALGGESVLLEADLSEAAQAQRVVIATEEA